MSIDYSKAKEKVEKYGQEHLLANYEKMTDENKQYLLEQIERIDFDEILELYKQGKRNNVENEKDRIEPIKAVDKDELEDNTKNKYREIGEDIIKNGRYAALTMAGGQGTRLGFDGPKGTFMIGLEPDKSLFEVICDNLKIAKEKYGVYIPWYIMTSRENDERTKEFFEENNYFDYDKSLIKFFKQGELSMVDFEGKIVLEENGTIKEAADGNGGIFKALEKNGILEDMHERGIRWVYVFGVDNVLPQVIDPEYIGATEYTKNMIASKATLKKSAEEKVGVFCKRNGKPGIVEYIEITKEMAEMLDYNNKFVYGDCNIVGHLFSIEALDKIKENKLPIHFAKKKANYLNENGEYITVEEPNAFKFETFIFDAFASFEDMLVYRVRRENEFSPIKNAEGADSPETAREAYLNYHNNI